MYLLTPRKRLRKHEGLNLTWKSQPTQYFPMVSQMQIPIPHLPSYFLSSSSVPSWHPVCILTNALPDLSAWAFNARSGRRRHGVRRHTWALGQLLDPCIPVLTSPRPMEQHLPWHRVRHRTTSSGVRGVIPVLVWNTNSKGRSVAWRMDRRTCRWLNPSHSTVCLSPSLQILASNYTWQCLLLVPSLAWLSSGSDSVGPKIACQEAARQGTRRRCWFCNKECETCSQPDTAQNQEAWKQQRMQGKEEGQGVRNKGVMVAVVTALMHEGVWFLMTIRSLNRAREEKKIAKGRMGSSNIVVGPRLSSPDLLGLT